MALTGMAVVLMGAQCGSGGSSKEPCEVVVLTDTSQVYVEESSVVMAKKDTVPRPYTKCVTIYASAKDTVPKP
jgi:hypothetical protein